MCMPTLECVPSYFGCNAAYALPEHPKALLTHYSCLADAATSDVPTVKRARAPKYMHQQPAHIAMVADLGKARRANFLLQEVVRLHGERPVCVNRSIAVCGAPGSAPLPSGLTKVIQYGTRLRCRAVRVAHSRLKVLPATPNPRLKPCQPRALPLHTFPYTYSSYTY